MFLVRVRHWNILPDIAHPLEVIDRRSQAIVRQWLTTLTKPSAQLVEALPRCDVQCLMRSFLPQSLSLLIAVLPVHCHLPTQTYTNRYL
ncbi:hypothetical protein EVAR_38333_1 [Eumeta japonica]|uniref:Uncharacterized protein n=1 Tax=Eumeta variegata TaxID=151549 RepID=A0A4C1X7D1_EUMVA|nr:hypothetical protein EVAR_38333_1 [Eumeta japonica]